MRSSTTPAVVQFGAIRAPRARKFSITRCPYAECTTSGCHCTPYSRRASSSNAATGEPADSPVTRKPSGARCTASPWLIQTDCSVAWPSNKVDPSGCTAAAVPPYSRSPVWATSPPRARAIAWKP